MTTFLRRPVVLAQIAAVLTVAAVSGCATNPVTGERQLALISESQEIAMGREAAQEAEASIGLVDDAGLQAYVKNIGTKLAASSERPALPWTFGVVDDPTPNAFALPGGFIYVTRGMMNLMDSEAELASVLGHEIGHVTARHAVTMISRQQLTQLGLGLGGVLFPDIAPATQALGAGMQLLFLRYGRDAERQADDLGFAYAHKHDYNMNEMADVFGALQRASELEQQSPLPSWLASHPAPAERIEAARARAAKLGGGAGGRIARAEYLQQIDGLTFGPDPRHGFFRENIFYHPELRFRMTLPSGWQHANLAQAVVSVSQNQNAAVRLSLARDNDPALAARRFASQQNVVVGGTERRSINGLPALITPFNVETADGAISGVAAHIEHRGRVYEMLSYAAAPAFRQYQQLLTGVIGSFGPVSDPKILNVEPKRIDIVTLRQSVSLAQFNESYPSSIPLPTLALMNQVAGPSARLESGALVKRVVGSGGF
jgi:predicted Zn-dependent protease